MNFSRVKNLTSLRQEKQRKLIFGFVFLVGILLFIALFFKFYSGIRNSKISRLSRVNIVIVSDKIILISFGEKEIILLNLPGSEKIQASRGFGEYPLASIYQLGELEKKGEELFSETLESFMGIPIEGSIRIKSLKCDLFAEQGQNCLEDLLFRSLKKELETRLSFFDLFPLWLRTRTTSKFNLKKYDFSNFDSKNRQDFVAKSFQDPWVLKENLSIAIFNGTEFAGLANQASRIITNFGGRVVNVGNAPLRAETILVSNLTNAKSYTLKRLRNLFSASWVEGEIEGGRAEIGIYLGRDYWEKYNEKW